jgi:hypothetical protein
MADYCIDLKASTKGLAICDMGVYSMSDRALVGWSYEVDFTHLGIVTAVLVVYENHRV